MYIACHKKGGGGKNITAGNIQREREGHSDKEKNKTREQKSFKLKRGRKQKTRKKKSKTVETISAQRKSIPPQSDLITSIKLVKILEFWIGRQSTSIADPQP